MSNTLDKKELERRTDSLFSSFYLMLLGVIQSAAIGYLAIKSFEYCSKGAWMVLPFSLITFIQIAIISYEYSTITGAYRWLPRYADVIIPLSFGLMEITEIECLIFPHLWWITTVVMYLIGILAYLNSWRNVKFPNFELSNSGFEAFLCSERIFIRSLKLCIFGVLYSTLGAAITLLTYTDFKKSLLCNYNLSFIFWAWQILLLSGSLAWAVLFMRKEQNWYFEFHRIFNPKRGRA